MRLSLNSICTADMSSLMPLSLMRAGEIACINQILGQTDWVHRLEELGVRRGMEVEMVQTGRPCIIRLAGQKLCFRADELTNVLVQPARDR